MLYLHKFRVDIILKYVSVENQLFRHDWYFATFQNSSENYATFTRSIRFRNLVLERSPNFGSNRNNLSKTIFIFKKFLCILNINLCIVAFAKALNLAIPINLLQFIPIFSYWFRLYLQLDENVRSFSKKKNFFFNSIYIFLLVYFIKFYLFI